MLNDLHHALRSLLRVPGYAAVIALTLALSIGATTTIYSVVNGVLLRPLPFDAPEQLVTLWQRAPGVGVDEDWFSPAQFFDIREGAASLEHVTMTFGQEVTLTSPGMEPARIGTLRVSSSFFDVLRVTPEMGRRFTAEDDAPGATPKVLLSHAIFGQRFGADPTVVGQTIELNGQGLQVVGVMPPLALDADIMPTLLTVPSFDLFLSFPIEDPQVTTRGSENYNVIGRLADGATLAQLDTELLAVAVAVTDDPGSLGAGLSAGAEYVISVVPLLDEVVAAVLSPLMLLLGATAILLLIACANVANLLLTRAATRGREISVRAALGARRSRVIGQAMIESLVLSIAGGIGGIAIAQVAVRALHLAAPPELPRLSGVSVDPGVMLFTAGLCVVSSLLFGIGPALRMSAASPGDVLRESSSAVGARSAWRRGGSRFLIVVQVALSLLLIVGAGLLMRTFWELQSVDPGFAPDRTLSFRISLVGDRYRTGDSRIAFFEQLFERLTAAPGVEAAGGTSLLPLTRGLAWTDYIVEGYNVDNPDARIVADVITVTPDYFQTMGTEVVAGRSFTASDSDEPLVVMVNRQFAEQFWPLNDAVGKWIATDPERPMTIVGVSETVRHYGMSAATRPAVFYPHRGRASRELFGVVGVADGGTGDRDLLDLAPTVTAAVRELDPQVAVSNIDSMRGRFNESLAQQRVLMWLLNFFGATALALATVGLYGVLAFTVATQTREMGIRKALGAQRWHLYSLVLRGAALMIATGIGLGVLAAFGTARLIQANLFGVSASDPVAFAAAVAVVLAVALTASFLPARRAARIDPMVALKQD
jgi:predicted permease